MMRVRLFLLALLVLASVLAAQKITQRSVPNGFQIAAITPDVTPAFLHSAFVSHQLNIATHAASLIELNDGKLRAFWFAGSREGAQDVTLRSAVFDGKNWGAEQTVINREQTQQGVWRYVKKLGNPVAARRADGTLVLYFVTVSLGGWAGSSISFITSHDEGASWDTPRRLITSPFFNISTLIKGTPFSYADGSLGLPVYHEFLGKFGELLRLSADGTVLDKQRLSNGKLGIQPVLLITDSEHATVLMRHTNAPPKRVIATRTQDGGQTWSVPTKLTIANPDAALTAVSLADGRMLAVLNNLEVGRHALSLMLSSDSGMNWRSVYEFEHESDVVVSVEQFAQRTAQLAVASDANVTDGAAFAATAQRNKCPALCDFEFSYPYLIQTQRGDFQLVYTWNRGLIKHVQFNHAWLENQLQEKHIKDTP
ncbi:MAG: exo-alpha-sialidase [Sideroxydans sp.]|nr:exo-alpha-sialidase [Sideroxydans sp.]